ncbi:flagellar FlbD family protein [Geobacter sp.]|uniref:flagellar FlbD family protein n=1 Tax=Geobacter sp. TaxID=46610 RepID=UPI002610C280|nr:flagellar FlbD family protein [Geobacter sp.]
MIKLTRLDGSELYVNPDLIETIEETPDTHITLSNGNRYLVLEKACAIIDMVVAYNARIMRRAATGTPKKYLFKRRRTAYRLCCSIENRTN